MKRLHLIILLSSLVVLLLATLVRDWSTQSTIQAWLRLSTAGTVSKKAIVSNDDGKYVKLARQHAPQAFSVLSDRKEAYRQAGFEKNWNLRGIAHLYVYRDILLVGQHIPPPAFNNNSNSSIDYHVIRIDNVYSALQRVGTGTTDSSQPSPPSCERLTLWIRARGPEIFAGKAQPVWDNNNDDGSGTYCYWSFCFRAKVPGDYLIDAKVLLFDAFNYTRNQHCLVQKGNVSSFPEFVRTHYPVHAGFKGFKLYGPDVSCCEICNRFQGMPGVPTCRYWASPPLKLPDPGWTNNGCELYFDANVTVDQIPFSSYILGDLPNVTLPKRRRLGVLNYFHGYPLVQEPDNKFPYFVGCGWHQMFTLDFPCLSAALDDKIYVIQESFVVPPLPPPPTGTNTPDSSSSDKLPLCTLEHELKEPEKVPSGVIVRGRWVKEPWPNETVCPYGFAYTNEVTRHDPDHPHCWFRDNLSAIGLYCAEMNCRFVPEASKWKTSFRDPQWLGAWKRYDCDYLEFTDKMLQKCVDILMIQSFTSQGKSVASAAFNFMQERIRRLQLYNKTDGITVTISTLALLHLTTRTDIEFKTWLQSQPNRSSVSEAYFVMGPYFLTSEREVFAHVEKMSQFDAQVKALLPARGYRYLNAFDLSAAMSYESSGQLDGMHITGPSIKMIITKLFHHLCSPHVEGIRL